MAESGKDRPASGAARRTRAARMGFRALVVDDDPTIAETFNDVLGHDFAVTRCANLAEGMARAADPGLDVALVDYRLPDGPGLELVKRLASISPPVPVVFITGFGTYTLAREVTALGVLALLEKPFSPRDLSVAIYKAVGERPAPGPRADAARDDRLQAVLSFLEERMFDGVREKDLLEKLGFSRSAFHRFFTERFGITFREYVARERLRMAKYLLATTALPVAEIAARLGIIEPGYFSAWFRKQTGSSALEYRKRATV